MVTGDVTTWIRGAESGDTECQNALWNHYFAQVIRLAQGRMFAFQTSVYDPEDAALSAMHSLFRGMHSGRFPQLDDRSNLWRLLVLITHRKVRAQWRKENATRRMSPADSDREFPIGEIAASDPTPESIHIMMDEMEKLLKKLNDAQLQRIALLRMDGFTQDEIADQLDCASRTIRRKLNRIRESWSDSDHLKN